MKIGIDAKWYFSGPSSGRVVVRNLVENMIKLSDDTSHVLVLFVLTSEYRLFVDLFSSYVTRQKLEIVPVEGRFNFLLNIFKVQSLAIKNQVEIVLYQNFIPLFPSKRIKNVAYVHDFLFLDYPQFFSLGENVIYRMMRFLVKGANHIVTISQSEKVRIKKNINFKDENISVVHHGVSDKFKQYSEEQRCSVKKKYLLPEKYILYIGRINSRKNIPVLIEALKYTHDSQIPLVLIGKKEHKSFDVDEFAKFHGVADRIISLGFLPEEDLVTILSASAVFCFPSFVEGFGLPPLEAMSTGVPVITTRGTSIPEVCGDAVLYFQPDNCEELGKLISTVITDSPLSADLVKKGLYQAAKFSWKKSAGQLLSVLEKV